MDKHIKAKSNFFFADSATKDINDISKIYFTTQEPEMASP